MIISIIILPIIDEIMTEESSSLHHEGNKLYCSPVSRHTFEPKQQLRCMFCMGRNCKHCGESAYLNQEKSAIPGKTRLISSFYIKTV